VVKTGDGGVKAVTSARIPANRILNHGEISGEGSRRGAMTTDKQTSVEAALDFISQHPHVFLLGRRADGFPTGYAMMSKVREGAVDFSTYRSSAKVKNLMRDGVAGILAASEAPDDERVVFAEGPVSLLEGGRWLDDDDEASGRPSSRFRPAVPAAIVETVGSRHDSGKRCVLRVTIEQARFSKRMA
jgi:hypothetical protein